MEWCRSREADLKRFVHVETGVVRTRNEWEESYDPSDLQKWGRTAPEVFGNDVGSGLLVEYDESAEAPGAPDADAATG